MLAALIGVAQHMSGHSRKFLLAHIARNCSPLANFAKAPPRGGALFAYHDLRCGDSKSQFFPAHLRLAATFGPGGSCAGRDVSGPCPVSHLSRDTCMVAARSVSRERSGASIPEIGLVACASSSILAPAPRRRGLGRAPQRVLIVRPDAPNASSIWHV